MPLDPIALGLPHREPFVFVDEVSAVTAGESAAGCKTFPAGDPVFHGHFPGDPIVPGVLLTEALAQIAGIAAGQPGLRLAAIKAMKFREAARPGEMIALRATKLGSVGGMWQFEVEARVGERVVAEGVIVLAGE
ncbi:MAG: 3-hydroxyacyl-ACP dehydratase FabZ family protein [Chthoniobacteraceae bacterium]